MNDKQIKRCITEMREKLIQVMRLHTAGAKIYVTPYLHSFMMKAKDETGRPPWQQPPTGLRACPTFYGFPIYPILEPDLIDWEGKPYRIVVEL